MKSNFHRTLLASSVAVSALWATQAPAAADPMPACDAELISNATSFPNYPDRARRGGTVILTLTVAPDGKVANAVVSGSSGSRSLDGAALSSAQTQWRFAPSNCGELFAKNVAVQFEPRPFLTLSTTKSAAYRRQLITAAERGCDVLKDAAGDSVIACKASAGEGRMRLAKR